MRLRYGGSAARWGFAVYLASKDGYEDSVLPTGDLAGAPEDALDTAFALRRRVNLVPRDRLRAGRWGRALGPFIVAAVWLSTRISFPVSFAAPRATT